MKSLLLIVFIALPTTAFAVENPAKFEAYKQRRAIRAAYALKARRLLNANRGPAVYRTAIATNVAVSPRVGIEAGWIIQPPIPLVPEIDYSTNVSDYSGYDGYQPTPATSYSSTR